MADSQITTIAVHLRPDEATALARLAARLTVHDCARHAAPATAYDGRPECDVMYEALASLSGALAGAGYMGAEWLQEAIR